MVRKIANYLVNIKWKDLTDEVKTSAKLVLMDTLGALIFGNQENEIQRLCRLSLEHDSGSVSVLGTPYKLSLYSAAFINGCGSVATEMDEGNQWSKGHPAVHVVPALLTYLQVRPSCTGKELLQTIITGYEVCSRFGRAVTLVPDAHAHGTWGTVGAAASLLLLDKASEEQLVEGIHLAASFALPTMWTAALEGALVRNAYVGHAIEMGIRTVNLVKSGIQSPDKSVEHVFGSVLGKRFDHQALTDTLGERWDIQLNYFKPYAFCRYVHAPIDAFAELILRNSIKPEEIKEIEVITYGRAATLCNQNPHNVLSAKFSIPYALAVWMKTKQAGPRSFSEELLFDSEIKAVANKVRVIYSKELDKDYPSIMPAVVRVQTYNGTIFENRCDSAKGGPNNPLQVNEIEKKFIDLTKGIITEDNQKKILEFIWGIENQKNVSQLIELCTPN